MELDEVVVPLATGLLLPSIAESMMVSRAVVSTVHVNDAGVGSTFPTPSTAATVNVYVPSGKLGKSLGLVHGSIVPPPGPVIVHTKWSTSSLGLPENVKLMELDEVVVPLATGLLLPSIAESMMVSRAVVSTVHIHNAGVGSTFPTPSTAATVNVYVPSANPLNV